MSPIDRAAGIKKIAVNWQRYADAEGSGVRQDNGSSTIRNTWPDGIYKVVNYVRNRTRSICLVTCATGFWHESLYKRRESLEQLETIIMKSYFRVITPSRAPR